MRSAEFKRKGTRIVYIPYGIEIADTEHARDAHFNNPVVRNAWRVFTFSERMREDYCLMCPNSTAVKCVGHPKFDGLYHRERFPLKEEIQKRAAGRRILVWHVHFLVGTVPFAKYSVAIHEPPWALSQSPYTARLPHFVHMVA